MTIKGASLGFTGEEVSAVNLKMGQSLAVLGKMTGQDPKTLLDQAAEKRRVEIHNLDTRYKRMRNQEMERKLNPDDIIATEEGAFEGEKEAAKASTEETKANLAQIKHAFRLAKKEYPDEQSQDFIEELKDNIAEKFSGIEDDDMFDSATNKAEIGQAIADYFERTTGSGVGAYPIGQSIKGIKRVLDGGDVNLAFRDTAFRASKKQVEGGNVLGGLYGIFKQLLYGNSSNKTQ